MKWSQFYIPTIKEVPKDATIQSHILMLRAGFVVKQGSGIYSYLPLGLKVLEKVERIIKEEMEGTGGQKVFLPHLVPKEFWESTGRYSKMGDALFKLKDRHHNDFLLGPTHEESVVDMVQGFVKSYKQLPLNFFQITKKFRDEIRPRYGVMRGREFFMMDGYTLHASLESLDEYYQRYKRAYRRAFVRIGLDTIPVSADSGDMGGEGSEEFMVRSHIGDDTIFSCSRCSYVANKEKATFVLPHIKTFEKQESKEIETPNVKTIQDLVNYCQVSEEMTAKAVVFKTEHHGWVVAMVQGDREVNEVKLQNLLKGDKFLDFTTEDLEKEVGPVGFLGPHQFVRKNGITMVLDNLLKNRENMLVGMNKRGYHYQGYSFVGLEVDYLGDISLARDGDICPECSQGLLESFSGIEVGHIFKLGNDYTKKMQLQVLDNQGKTFFPLMGCYGIGVDRSLAAIIEQNNDELGMILPLSIAPFHIVITPIGEEHQELGLQIYNDLSESYEVLLDDRDISAGMKLKEADLIGIPIRVTIGKKYKEEGLLGLRFRNQTKEKFITLEKLSIEIRNFVENEKHIEMEKLRKIDQL